MSASEAYGKQARLISQRIGINPDQQALLQRYEDSDVSRARLLAHQQIPIPPHEALEIKQKRAVAARKRRRGKNLRSEVAKNIRQQKVFERGQRRDSAEKEIRIVGEREEADARAAAVAAAGAAPLAAAVAGIVPAIAAAQAPRLALHQQQLALDAQRLQVNQRLMNADRAERQRQFNIEGARHDARLQQEQQIAQRLALQDRNQLRIQGQQHAADLQQRYDAQQDQQQAQINLLAQQVQQERLGLEEGQRQRDFQHQERLALQAETRGLHAERLGHDDAVFRAQMDRQDAQFQRQDARDALGQQEREMLLQAHQAATTQTIQALQGQITDQQRQAQIHEGIHQDELRHRQAQAQAEATLRHDRQAMDAALHAAARDLHAGIDVRLGETEQRVRDDLGEHLRRTGRRRDETPSPEERSLPPTPEAVRSDLEASGFDVEGLGQQLSGGDIQQIRDAVRPLASGTHRMPDGSIMRDEDHPVTAPEPEEEEEAPPEPGYVDIAAQGASSALQAAGGVGAGVARAVGEGALEVAGDVASGAAAAVYERLPSNPLHELPGGEAVGRGIVGAGIGAAKLGGQAAVALGGAVARGFAPHPPVGPDLPGSALTARADAFEEAGVSASTPTGQLKRGQRATIFYKLQEYLTNLSKDSTLSKAARARFRDAQQEYQPHAGNIIDTSPDAFDAYILAMDDIYKDALLLGRAPKGGKAKPPPPREDPLATQGVLDVRRIAREKAQGKPPRLPTETQEERVIRQFNEQFAGSQIVGVGGGGAGPRGAAGTLGRVVTGGAGAAAGPGRGQVEEVVEEGPPGTHGTGEVLQALLQQDIDTTLARHTIDANERDYDQNIFPALASMYTGRGKREVGFEGIGYTIRNTSNKKFKGLNPGQEVQIRGIERVGDHDIGLRYQPTGQLGRTTRLQGGPLRTAIAQGLLEVSEAT